MNADKHGVNLENWNFIRNLTREEYESKYKGKYFPSVRGLYQCKKCKETKSIQNKNFKRGVVTCDCVKLAKAKRAEGAWKTNIERWTKVRNLTKEEQIEWGYLYKSRNGVQYGYYKCTTCGDIRVVNNGNFKHHEVVCNSGCHGSSRSPFQVIKGVDDLATMHPNLVQYFINKQEASRYKPQSDKRVSLKCPRCNHKKGMRISGLVNQGFSCPVCSDGHSYPERVVTNVLKQLGVDFQTQLSKTTFDWCGIFRYDFYIPEFNIIIETHGRQHYQDTTWASYEEQHNRDLDKWMTAQMKLGSDLQYIIIDCRQSNLSFIKNNLLDSQLSTMFNLQGIDWEEVGRQSDSGMMNTIVNHYNETLDSTRQIANIFNIHPTTVLRYLKRGSQLGICKYNVDEVKRQQRVPIVGVHIETGKMIKFESQSEAGRLGFNQSKISLCCRGERKSHRGYAWYHEKDYVQKQEQSNIA